MYFYVICQDKPDSADLRGATRPAHLEYVLASDCVQLGGALMTEDRASMIGTLILLDVADREAAEAWAAADPYAKAGLFERVEIHPWTHSIGALEAP